MRYHHRYHHIGIPTTEVREGERHLPDLGMYVSGYETGPYRVEWIEFLQLDAGPPGCAAREARP